MKSNAYLVSNIFTGIKGEKYPCKNEIFEMTYEKVENLI